TAPAPPPGGTQGSKSAYFGGKTDPKLCGRSNQSWGTSPAATRIRNSLPLHTRHLSRAQHPSLLLVTWSRCARASNSAVSHQQGRSSVLFGESGNEPGGIEIALDPATRR